MPMAAGTDWRKDFGIEGRRPPSLFTSKDELTPSTPQAHLPRRAFEILGLDGILCTDHARLIYFKQLRRISADAVRRLHQQFWNHGGAPILVLITDDRVHVYSGMTRPAPAVEGDRDLPGLVETLDRVAEGL